MKQFDWVILVNEEPYLKNNLFKGCSGVVLKIEEAKYIVSFFNNKNEGDTAVVKVDKKDVKKDPYSMSPELEKLLKDNFEKLLNDKDRLNRVPMEDYDEVEVIVEKEEYAKAGVHKGEIGYVMDFKAVDNHLLVDFPYLPEEYWDDALCVDYRDLKILRRNGKEYKGE